MGRMSPGSSPSMPESFFGTPFRPTILFLLNGDDSQNIPRRRQMTYLHIALSHHLSESSQTQPPIARRRLTTG